MYSTTACSSSHFSDQSEVRSEGQVYIGKSCYQLNRKIGEDCIRKNYFKAKFKKIGTN